MGLMRVVHYQQRTTVEDKNKALLWKACLEVTCGQIHPHQIDDMPKLFEPLSSGHLPSAVHRCYFDLKSQHRNPACYQMRGTGGDYILIYADGAEKDGCDCELSVFSSRQKLGTAAITYRDSGPPTYRWEWKNVNV